MHSLRVEDREIAQLPPIEKLGSFERETVSETTRQLLCHFAAGDANLPLHELEADWEEVFQAVCRNGLVGLAYVYLRHHPGEYPPAEFKRWIAWAYLLTSGHLAKTRTHVKAVLSRLAETGVDFLVLKGPAIAQMVYPDPALRWYSDLDLHVRDKDVPTVHKLLLDLGLNLQEDEHESPPKLVPQAPGSEWHYFTPDLSFLVELHGDDLLHAGLIPRDYEGMWARATPLTLHGVSVKTLSLEDQLIALSAHVHYHGYTRLNWLSDIAFIVRAHGHELDWERLIEMVRLEEVQVPVYYTLYFVERLLGVAAPETVLARIRPDRFRCWLHERYMPEEKIVSLQPMPRPDFSFYFLPLFKRLLPDLLVMGRRAEKLHYLMRLLTPSPGWLRHYYGVADSESVARHYVLHPLLLAGHYLVAVASAVAWVWNQDRVDDGGASPTWWSAHPQLARWTRMFREPGPKPAQ